MFMKMYMHVAITPDRTDVPIVHFMWIEDKHAITEICWTVYQLSSGTAVLLLSTKLKFMFQVWVTPKIGSNNIFWQQQCP